MRRALALFLLGAAGFGAAPAAVAHPGRVPARLLVYAQEWSLSPSRQTVPAGRVIVQLWNRGMDPHDLRIRRVDAAGEMTGPTQAVALTLPGQVSTATWSLTAGRYQLYCSLPGHMARGMRVRIRVVAP